MYTRCPKCSTCFRVTDRHLAIAKGKVRCGQCQLVFNAPEHAIDDLPANSLSDKTSEKATPLITPAMPTSTAAEKTKAKKPASPAKKTKVAETVAAAPKKDKVKKAAKSAEVKKPKAPVVKKPKIAPPLYKNDVSPEGDDKFDNNFDLDAAIDELTKATEDSYKYDNKEDASLVTEEAATEKYIPSEDNDIFETDAYTKTDAASVTDILNEMEGQLSLDIPEPDSDNKNDLNDEFDFIELDNEIETSAQDVQPTNEEIIKNNFDFGGFDFDDEVGNTEFEEDKLENKNTDDNDSFDQLDETDFEDGEIEDDQVSDDINSESDETDVPFQLRNDIERLQTPARRRVHPLIMFSFILILLTLSFSQLAYFRAHELVKLIPSTAPYLETYCEKVDCHYSGPLNIKQIQLISRDVRLHPKEKKALLISAAMINNAAFSQPYPKIHIRLSDISGNIIAERIFNAKTYLGKLNSPFLLMQSKTPVHINFEVVDPGRDAINFEFKFL